MGGDKFLLKYPTFHTKMEYVWIDSRRLQHLDPSNFSLEKYNEWWEKVETAIWAMKWSRQGAFQPWVGSKLAWPLSTFRIPRLSEFGLIWAIHISSTLSMSNH
eukprot:scaffold851_cov78-Cyclotella_meneghiniana.AAC.1